MLDSNPSQAVGQFATERNMQIFLKQEEIERVLEQLTGVGGD